MNLISSHLTSIKWILQSLIRRLRLRFFPIPPLLSPAEHKELLEKSRRFEHILEDLGKQLKCSPSEVLSYQGRPGKLDKLLAHIDELQKQIDKYTQK